MNPQTTPAPSAVAPAVEHPHAHAAADVAAALQVDPDRGLGPAEVADRRAATGPNELVTEPPPSLLSRFVAQFRSMLILVLVGAAALSAIVGEFKDAVVVAIVLLINAVLGTVQEARAEKSMRALSDLLPSSATVRRDGRTIEIPAVELVVGDLVRVEAGDRVPADGRVVLDAVLAADESSLTGETAAVTKRAGAVVTPDTPVADRTNMLWMNTTVVRGRGELVVTGTGMDTRIGEVAQLLADAPHRRTPLQRQIDDLARRLALVALVAVVAVFSIAMLRGDTLTTAALDAIALAIAAIPEGLPAVVTITLALGTGAMARENAIVKRLTSVETLGSTQVICTDKTGTLTRNEMTVRAVVVGDTRHEVGGEGYGPSGSIQPPLPDLTRGMQAMVLCNDAVVRDGEVVGDPTEAALVVLATKAGLDVEEVRRGRRRLGEVPFDAATKLMATLHAAEGGRPGTLVAVKGAPDVVLRRCGRVATADGPAALDDGRRDAIDRQISALASEGLRTLAIATRELDRAPDRVDDPEAELDGLTFEFLVGIVDPPREGVADAIRLAHRAGIRVMMVTGDHPDTAAAIAHEIGIRGDVATGADLDALDDDALATRVEQLGVCARVAPEHKVRLVSALQANGRTTAMTGDGVNDAPALKRADIGVAMGIAGTEVTKEAGDLVLADDDFSTIVTAVERGRGIYDNIVSFVRFQLATNIGAIIAILGARLVGLPAPFTPIQVLWVNLIMDGPPALALGADPVAPDVMERRPRDPDASILDGARLRRLLLTGAVMGVGTITLFRWALDTGDRAFATTLAFTTFVLFQFFNAVNARLEFDSVFTRHTLRNGKLWGALAVVLGLQVLAVQVPAVGGLVDVVPLGWRDWLLAAGVASSLLVVEEVRKAVWRARH